MQLNHKGDGSFGEYKTIKIAESFWKRLTELKEQLGVESEFVVIIKAINILEKLVERRNNKDGP